MFSATRQTILVSLLALLSSAASGAENNKAARADLYGDPLPPGAVARLGSMRFRFAQTITSLAFSPDGKRLAGASSHQIIIWDVANGKRLREFKLDSVNLRLVAFTDDGKVLALGTEDSRRWSSTYASLVLLRPEAELEPIRLPVMALHIQRLALSPDGKRLLVHTGSWLDILDLATEKRVRTITIDWKNDPAKHQPLLLFLLGAMALSPDHRTVATIGQNKAIHLGDLRTEKAVQRRPEAAKQDSIYDLTFSRDGKKLISRGESGIFLWDVAGEKPPRRIAGKEVGQCPFALSPDGKTIASVDDKEKAIVFWDTATGRPARPDGMEQGALTALSYLDDKTLVTIHDYRRVGFWDALSGKRLRRLAPEESVGRILTVSLDGALLAGVSEDHRVGVWDSGSGKIRWRSTMPTEELTHLAFTSDGKQLRGVAGGRGARYLLSWDVATARAGDRIALRGGCLAFSADGSIVSIVVDQPPREERHLFRLGRGGKWRPLGAPIPLPRDGYVSALSPDARTLLLKTQEHSTPFRDVRLGLVETVSGSFIGWLRSTTEKEDSPVRDAVFSPDGKQVASTHKDGSVRLWDVVTRTELEHFTADEGESTSIVFSPDGQRLASARNDRTVLIWHVRPHFDLDRLWDNLAGTDVQTAQRAIAKLVASPERSVAFLQRRLPALPKGDEQKWRRLIADLDSDLYAVRQKAQEELEKVGEAAEDVLLEALAGKPSLEQRRRVDDLLDRLEETRRENTPDDVRIIRAVQVLETIGSAEARQALKKLSDGASGALRTREAKAALRRLESRAAK